MTTNDLRVLKEAELVERKSMLAELAGVTFWALVTATYKEHDKIKDASMKIKQAIEESFHA